MRFAGDCYRGHDPKWAYTPISGDGAAVYGARFNRKGLPALYLGLSIDGAVNEIAQGFPHRLDPLTICVYSVDCEDIVDLRDAAGCRASGVDPAELGCAWKADIAAGKTPASWRIADRLIKAGAAGILAPSFAKGAKPDHANLILWKWSPSLPHRVEAHDPSGRLPKNQLSWT